MFLNISEILKLLKSNQEADFEINNIVTNSKDVKKNDVFIAINNGHNYVLDAIKRGASAVIVEDLKQYDCLTINVDNTIEALGKIAKYKREHVKTIVLAITGSTGKTTTKELISLFLSDYKVLKSLNNQNNHIGLPDTLLKINDNYDFAVLEMGMNHFNEISYLSKICQPDYGIITNIGSSHIGNLGSIKNIKKAKLEIKDGMSNDNLIFLNNKRMKNVKGIKVDKKIMNVQNIKYHINFTEFDIDGVHFVFNMPGKLIFNNLLIAIKVGLIFNVSLKRMSKLLKKFNTLNGRLNFKKNNNLVIDDSYNSSYEALINGLDLLIKEKRKKVIILGDMLELGKYSKKYHKKVNRYLKKIKNKEVLLIGEYTKYIKGKHFESISDINEYISSFKNCIIYIKGSHNMHLDKIKTP